MVSVFLVVFIVMAPKEKNKTSAKLAAKRKLKSDNDIDIEKVTPAKRKRSSIIASEPPEPVQPAPSLCSLALPTHLYPLSSNALAMLLSPVYKIADCQEMRKCRMPGITRSISLYAH